MVRGGSVAGARCLDRLGMRGVCLLPYHHGVMPAKAGIQSLPPRTCRLDPRLRGDDGRRYGIRGPANGSLVLSLSKDGAGAWLRLRSDAP
jgi:hypothetical protein